MRLDADSEIEAFSLLITHADPKIFTHMQTPRYSHTCRPQDIHRRLYAHAGGRPDHGFLLISACARGCQEVGPRQKARSQLLASLIGSHYPERSRRHAVCQQTQRTAFILHRDAAGDALSGVRPAGHEALIIV